MLVAVLVMLSALGACSSGDDGSDPSDRPDATVPEDAYLDALTAVFSEDQGLSDPAAACVGRAFLGAVGADVLDEAGVTPDDLAGGEDLESLGLDIDRDAVVADATRALEACDITTELNDMVVTSLSVEGSALTEPMVTCIGDHADDRLLIVIAESFVDFDPTRYRLPFLEAFGDCPAAFAEIAAGTFSGADGRPVTSQARACLETYITQHPDDALRLAGDQDEVASLFEDLATTCHPIHPP